MLQSNKYKSKENPTPEERRNETVVWKEEENGGGGGGWFQGFAESTGVGAINLASISQLMNVIKIQPPAS